MESNLFTSEDFPPSSASLDSRLTVLEGKLGQITELSSPSLQAQELSSRLDRLQSIVDGHTTVTFRETLQESLKLLKDLDPDIALTHQQQPLLYKRQQLLAVSSQLQLDMQQLDVILKLLTYETKEKALSTTLSSSVRLDQVTQAPLVSSPYYSQSLVDQERLYALRVIFGALNDRISKIQKQMQHLLESYHTVMAAASEKCILAAERASSKI
jgi:hypothetical protein